MAEACPQIGLCWLVWQAVLMPGLGEQDHDKTTQGPDPKVREHASGEGLGGRCATPVQSPKGIGHIGHSFS